jgi:RND family efflux transporter MFP subunit
MQSSLTADIPMTKTIRNTFAALSAGIVLAACAPADAHTPPAADGVSATGSVITIEESSIASTLDASGVAAPMREATISTKLMSSVVGVDVIEGSLVRAGQTLVRLDARDLAAKREQVQAGMNAAQAMQAQASAHAARIRALHADDAAPKAMLEQAETQLAQAEAGLRAAQAASSELAAVESYAALTAPFAGTVTARFVDPGAFAAPGAPLVTLQDATQLRITVHVSPASARALQRGNRVNVEIEGRADVATIEGVVPAMGGLYAINALVDNRDGRHLANSAATLSVPVGERRGIAVPEAALIREGDLVGVLLRTAQGDVRRWIRIGAVHAGQVEVTAGLRAGDQVVIRDVAGIE